MPRLSLLVLPLALAVSACELFSDDEDTSVQIAIEQSLTGETTSAGTFQLSGSFADEGSTTETLVFGGPLNQPVVPVTFERTLVGQDGQITISGAATLTFSSATAATLSGDWTVESGTGRYANLTGRGALSGSANFGAVPPTASLTYVGELNRR